MTFSNYGITLRKISTSDLELIRNWRNSEYVKQFMVFQGYISPENQIDWFNKIDNSHNFYFLVLHENVSIGLANIKDIDYELNSGESGIFMKSEEYTNSDFGVRAALALLDFAFFTINLQKIYQTITLSNKAAQNFNKHLGVTITEIQNGIIYGYLEKENYLLHTHKIRKFLNQ